MAVFTTFNIIEALFTAIVGITVAFVPVMTEKSIAFGVRIPAAHGNSGVVKSAKRTYTFLVLVSTVVLSIVAVALPSSYVILLSVLPVILIAITFSIYLPEHYLIEKTKKSEGWSDEAVQSVTADFTTGETDPFPWMYAVPGILILISIFITGIVDYQNIPSRFATHFNAGGVPDQYSTKSVGSVFAPGFMGAGITALLALFSYAVSRSPLRIDTTVNLAGLRAKIFRKRMSATMLAIPAFVNLTLMIASMQLWHLIDLGSYQIVLTLIPIIAMVAAVLHISLRTGQMGSNLKISAISMTGRGDSQSQPEYGNGPGIRDSKDDDSLWRAGIIYVNRNDGRILVPKRFGVGYTFNFGHPASWIVLIAILGVPLVILTATFLFH